MKYLLLLALSITPFNLQAEEKKTLKYMNIEQAIKSEQAIRQN